MMSSAPSRAHECAGRNAHSRVWSERGDWGEIVQTRRNSTQTPVSHFFEGQSLGYLEGSARFLSGNAASCKFPLRTLPVLLIGLSDVNRRTLQLLRCNPHAKFSLRDATIPGWCRRFDRMHASDEADQKNRTRWQPPREFCRRSRAIPGPV
jgi:hypothetical protein